jgi:hypothetical protein
MISVNVTRWKEQARATACHYAHDTCYLYQEWPT